jgi:uncharacterized glyoxalase superfamily protein PhnB
LQVSGLETFYEEICERADVHPLAPLQTRPWGTREFTITDQDGNLVTFFQWMERPQPRVRRQPPRHLARR